MIEHIYDDRAPYWDNLANFVEAEVAALEMYRQARGTMEYAAIERLDPPAAGAHRTELTFRPFDVEVHHASEAALHGLWRVELSEVRDAYRNSRVIRPTLCLERLARPAGNDTLYELFDNLTFCRPPIEVSKHNAYMPRLAAYGDVMAADLMGQIADQVLYVTWLDVLLKRPPIVVTS